MKVALFNGNRLGVVVGEQITDVTAPLPRWDNGYAQARDGGAAWVTQTERLKHHYLRSVAVDPGNPDSILVSACRGPEQAHLPPTANRSSIAARQTHPGRW
jgi:hypothetical protein